MSGAIVCWKCGDDLKRIAWPITRLSRCPECFADLHCCIACRKYAPKYDSKCSDERTDPPARKDSANFCSYFAPQPGAYDAAGHSADRDARAAAAALFGDGADPSEGSDAETSDAMLSDEARALAEAEKLFRGDG